MISFLESIDSNLKRDVIYNLYNKDCHGYKIRVVLRTDFK